MTMTMTITMAWLAFPIALASSFLVVRGKGEDVQVRCYLLFMSGMVCGWLIGAYR